IGFPIRITIGPRTLAEGLAEVGMRDTGEVELVPLDEVVTNVQKQIRKRLC
ncbi:MAG: hypothetical protein GX316_09140, partial [Firmicutes bacterium]|nr:hypothetical protein [Bacillota bacterium]